MKLSFSINGREALPVRAVPWVVGAEAFTRKVLLPPSLIVLSARTACDAKDTIPCSPLLGLYRYDKNSVLPVTSERLDATAPEHDFQPEADEPLHESTSRLPAGVFVFLDELRRFVDWIYPPGCHDGECRDAIALNTSPDLPDEMIERLQEGFVAPRPNAASERSSPRKILFWLAPNEILIPADQVPGAIADVLYPRPNRDGGPLLNDPDTVPRLLAEREHAKMLRMKFPHLTSGDKFSIGDLNDYLKRLGMVAESRHRREALDSLDPESRWQRRQFEDAFNAVREPVGEARRCASALPAERCAELANQHELSLSHWIELVGLGIGRHESYDIGRNGIAFRNWEDDFIAASPIEWQADMERDIEIAPRLNFPCAPAELVKFVDAAIGIHCFNVPEAFRRTVIRNAQAERCDELAALPKLLVHHWEELTGIGICKGGAYTVSQSGVYPEQYSDDDLRSLTTEERRILIEIASRPPLLFPCTPSQLLEFMDGGSVGDFDIPAAFSAAVESRALLVQKDGEQNTSPETSENNEPIADRTQSKVERGITKAEILAVEWPMPAGAPSLASILDKIPRWVNKACIKVGRAGKGQSGSHLWNPAVLAVCLAARTPHKKWVCNQLALTNFLRGGFSDYFDEWEEKREML